MDAPQNDGAEEIARKTYPLSVTGTVVSAISLCLSLITTSIAIISFKLAMADRTKERSHGGTGVSRNPINDESSRQARDALALNPQLENWDHALVFELQGVELIAIADGLVASITEDESVVFT
ncbi:hypothetical protein F4677DRAFT_402266 [Hypoxylon crocopeplum]|nr:hypothetical protein F4677DRAFT_402266 [Hypoxylon crocopeplum]